MAQTILMHSQSDAGVGHWTTGATKQFLCWCSKETIDALDLVL